MSRVSWRSSIKRAIRPLSPSSSAVRLAVVGIGSELWGDDAAGVQAARLLQSAGVQSETLLVVDAGPVPENFSGQLRRFQPEYILLIDAVRPQLPDPAPGRIFWIELSDLEGISALTHGMPLSVLGEYLVNQLHCDVGLLGIEGAGFDFGQPLSPPVRRAVKKVQKFFLDWIIKLADR